MNLKKKIIPKSLFQKLLLGLMLIFAVFTSWFSFTAFQHIQYILEKDIAPASTKGMECYTDHHSVKFRSFTFTRTANIDSSYTYVTLTDMTLTSTIEESWEILSSASTNEEILGLSSHPSFIVSDEHRNFWFSQIYLEFGLLAGGIILIITFIVWVTSLNFYQYQKLFTRSVYQRVQGLFIILFVGFIADVLIYARKISFLFSEFGLVQPITSGISWVMILVLILLLLVIIFLRKGIPMQNEQDLTV